ncbi:MAG: hypothetical protein ACM3NO_07640 [Deltaproteobacteria bacterium]
MSCPICEKRKAKRFCPARGENICSLCCGTEREVTIDCPPDCSYLAASRQHERREVDWSTLPFADSRIPTSFARSHGGLLNLLSFAVSKYAAENRLLVDTDAQESLRALAEAYRTLSAGIFFERPPDYSVQRGLYEALKAAIEDFKKAEVQKLGLTATRESDIRDALIFLTQLAALRSNGRPKGRAFLDLVRSQFRLAEAEKTASNLVVLP